MTRSGNWGHFARWLPLLSAVGATVVFLLIDATSGFDIWTLLYSILLIPLLTLLVLGILAFRAFRTKTRPSAAILLAIPIYWAMTWILLINGEEARERERWLFESSKFKRQVMAQPAPTNGELRQIDFDGWGFFAMDTEVYLVFDPSDSLRAASQSRRPAKVAGIPCEVPCVWRLEPQWYAVKFYTSEVWGQCG